MAELIPTSDEIDIRQVLKDLFKNKGTIIKGILVCILFSVIISFIVPQSYKSEGFFSVSGPNIPSFKAYECLYTNTEMLAAFLDKYYEETWNIDNSIFEDSYKPVYAYGLHLEELIKDNYVIGIEVSSIGDSPAQARTRALILGSYLTTTRINKQMWDYFGKMEPKLEGDISIHRREILGKKILIELLEDKLILLSENLTQVYNENPSYERHVIQIDEATEKYLPPQQQLVANKIKINNMENVITNLEREIETNLQLLGFLGVINKYFEVTNNFLIERNLLDTILHVKKKYFHAMKIDHADNKAFLMMKKKGIDFVANVEAFKFQSGPNLPEDPKPQRIIITAFILLVFLSGSVIYSVLNNWWRQKE